MTNGNANLSSKDTNTETSPHWSITGSANCLPIGTHLAEFEITGVVGEGGFGNVYLAFDHSLQRTVAIKEYMPVALASRGADNARAGANQAAQRDVRDRHEQLHQ